MFRSLFLLLLASTLFASHNELTLIQTVKQEQNTIKWTLQKSPNELTIQGVDSESTTTISGEPSFDFSTFSYSSPTTNYAISISNGILTVQGTTEHGERKSKRYNLKNEPWIQQFWFGLMPFLKSGQKSMKFSIINPKDFDRVRMVAYREHIVPLTVNGKDRPALQVKITLQGFKSMFWSGHVWYDPQTYEFIKYEATSGPNTPLMTVVRHDKEA